GGRHIRRRADAFRPGGRPVWRSREGAQYDARRGRDQRDARPHGPRGPGPRGGRRAGAAHRALRHAVRRRCRVRGEHRHRDARDTPADRGPRGPGGANGGGACRAARAGHRGYSGIGRSCAWRARVNMTERLERDVADVARKWVPDPRLGVLEVSVEPQRLAGCTTSREALAALRRIAADAGRAADIRLLPDASVRDEPAAVVTAAVAPLLREPRITADRVSEALHGETLALLERGEADVWLRVRAGDGYHAWTHAAYLAVARS